MAHTVELELAGRTLRLETGHMAKQADGSVLATYGDTYVLATAVASQTAKKDIDFLPLTVDYQEKAYAAGKIPGGYFKREGQPSEKEKLSSRLIDRPMRPLFPEGWYFETQVIRHVGHRRHHRRVRRTGRFQHSVQWPCRRGAGGPLERGVCHQSGHDGAGELRLEFGGGWNSRRRHDGGGGRCGSA